MNQVDPRQGLPHVDPALDWLLAAYRNEAAFELIDLALAHVDDVARVELLLRKSARLRLVGRLEEAAVAAHGVGLRIQALAFVPGMSISQATAAANGQESGINWKNGRLTATADDLSSVARGAIRAYSPAAWVSSRTMTEKPSNPYSR